MLRDETVTSLIEIVASDAPAPGGGSVAALCGSLSAALMQMVGGLTTSREKYKEYWNEIGGLAEKAVILKTELLKLVDDDTETYNLVTAAMSMPKDTPEQKKARSEAMQNALKSAALVPFKTMEKCLECALVIKAAYGKTNASAISDLGVAALCAATCVRGAWLNVKINLSSIKDAEFAESYRAKGMALLSECEQVAEEVYSKIEASI